MKKFLAALFISLSLFSSNAFAVGTVLPDSADARSRSAEECRAQIISIEENAGEDVMKSVIQSGNGEFILACAIKSGYIKMWMVPFFVTRILNFIIGLSGLLSVLMIMVGAFFYIAGGLNEDKEKGKTIITYALGGFVLVLLAWAIVNAILLLITS